MRILALFVCVFLLNTSVLAQYENDAFQSLNLSLSSRQAVLNQPLSIYNGDVENGINNPSMLNDGMYHKMSLNFVDYFADINFISASYAFPLKQFGTIGVSVKSIGYGEFTQTDYTSQNLGNFNANEQIISLGVSKRLSEKWVLGANLKTLFSNFESYQSTAIASDLALAYTDVKNNFFMSLIAKNYGRQLSTYASEKEDLPFHLDFGVSKRLEHLPFRFSLGYKNIERWDLTNPYEDINSNLSPEPFSEKGFGAKLFRHIDLGGELSIGKRIQLRMGYNPRRRQELKLNSYLGMVGFSWGVGIKLSHFTINYGRSTYHLHGSPNYFSFITDFSKFYKKDEKNKHSN